VAAAAVAVTTDWLTGVNPDEAPRRPSPYMQHDPAPTPTLCAACIPVHNRIVGDLLADRYRLADEAARLRAELERVTAEKAAAVMALDDSLDFPGGIA
jgi:hypothetical protein